VRSQILTGAVSNAAAGAVKNVSGNTSSTSNTSSNRTSNSYFDSDKRPGNASDNTSLKKIINL